MAIERKPIVEDDAIYPEEGGMTIDLPEEEDDYSAYLSSLEPDEEELPPPLHEDNLAERMEESDLRTLANELLTRYEEDLESRSEWEERYAEGIKLLGIVPEEKTDPWPGAAGAYHPLLAETIVAFQANAIMELVPASGPAKFKCVGAETTEKLKLGRRVANELNYQLMEKMSEWRADMENLLFRLPQSGLVLKKTYFDPLRKRPVSRMVPGEDFIVQYGASDLETTPRYCHRDLVFRSNLKGKIAAGEYRDIEIDFAHTPVASEAREAEDEIEGFIDPGVTGDQVEVLEFHVDLVLDDDVDFGRPVPYIVTILNHDATVLSIRRNWDENDPLFLKRSYFTPYNYMPGYGFYGFGVIHLVGGGAEAATALMRQLIDAGTLSNVPSGFKANTFRVKGDDTPVRPGEFRDVDVGGDDIQKALYPLPYKEPSATSLQLLQNIVEEVRRVASVADMKIGDQSSQSPVGTTLALLERSLRVMSAVHARLHESLKKELKLIARIIKERMGPNYEYDPDLGFSRADDFGGPVDVIPVSDPNSSTQAQRVITYQAAINIAATAPQVYDLPRLHRGMLDVLGIAGAEQIVPLPEDLQPVDPVSENMAILMMKPVKAFIEQDHEAHLRVHMAALQDPKMQAMVGQSPQAQAIQAGAWAHVQEHMAYAYRREIERKLGVPLPMPDERLPDDTEALIANLAAAAAEQLLGDHAAEAQAQMIGQKMQDPEIQLEQQRVQIQDKNIEYNHQEAMARLEFDRQKEGLSIQRHQADLESKEAVASAQTAAQLDRNQKDFKVQSDRNEITERVGLDRNKRTQAKQKAAGNKK